ncbi:short-chain dehydrogenase reductase 2 [Aspergillus sclerotialis]|uniref:Short-chain dehydrogenase/reductase 3 n=1 Tax=Aspergillus sclerotialis TaxID=2070753 RepID=A0A3A2ZV68_9EURO|nr:short-chain dehydrogenase reductase 2 [Aspergillus sclerotialis]
MSSQKQVQLCLDAAQSMVTRLPPSVQRALVNPYVKKGVAFLVALRLLKGFSGYLSKRAQNSWLTIDRWDPKRELAVITGGCGGIGKKIMEDLNKKNVKVIILDIKEPDFPLPPNVFFYKTDIISRPAVKESASQIKRDHGIATILINNAGVANSGTILDEPDEKIRLTMEVNTLSHFWTVKEFLPGMIQKDHGHIVTIASLASFVSFAGITDYSCSKASALAFHEGLTQEIRHWYKSKKIRTSVIHPTWIRTPLIDAILQAGKEWKQPILEPEQVSSAVVNQIVSGNGGQVLVPGSSGVVSMVRGFPQWLQERIRNKTSMMFVRLRELELEIGK